MNIAIASIVVVLAIAIQFSIAWGAYPPMDADQVLDEFNLIVIGTVADVKKSDDMPPVYKIEVEETVKPGSSSINMVSATGCDPNHHALGVPCPSYDVGDRGLFLISDSDDGYELSFRSQTSEVDCTAEQFLANYRGLNPTFFWTQDGQSKIFFTGKPIDIHYIIGNPDMEERDYSLRFLTGTIGSEFSDVVNGTISECMGYVDVTTSFVPTKMGSYSFDMRADGGGSGSCCTAVIDYGASPREQYDAKIRGQDVWCGDGLVLVLKNDGTEPTWDNHAACVTQETAERLIAINWGFVLQERNGSSYFGNR